MSDDYRLSVIHIWRLFSDFSNIDYVNAAVRPMFVCDFRRSDDVANKPHPIEYGFLKVLRLRIQSSLIQASNAIRSLFSAR